ncbi:MAG: ABC transporter substrate-binding protein [Treponemataceae bacterium]
MEKGERVMVSKNKQGIFAKVINVLGCMDLKYILALLLCVMAVTVFSCAKKDQSTSKSEKNTFNVISDMRGKNITIPKNPERVVIIDKGFVLQNMVAMGVENKIVATGGIIDSKEKIEKRDSITLFPKIYDLPLVGYPTGAVDFEAIASVKPDLIILRNSEYIKNSEITKKAIDTIENQLNLPLVVINGPGCYDTVELKTHYEGIKVLGQVFNKSERAEQIIKLMKDQVELVEKRTLDIKDEDKPSVMYIGLLKDKEVGVVWGKDMGDAKFAREHAGIKNVYDEHKRTKMSAEQLIALNPDVIILCTNRVTPDINIFKNDEYKNLANINAIKNNRISSLGLLTWWGDFRLEFPTILTISAKTAYPEKFKDIKVSEYVDEYHRKLYGLNEEKIKELREVQLLSWMEERGF